MQKEKNEDTKPIKEVKWLGIVCNEFFSRQPGWGIKSHASACPLIAEGVKVNLRHILI